MLMSPSASRSRPEKAKPAEMQRKLNGLEQTLAWRAIGLLDLGFTIQQVLVLVNRTDVVHDAEALIAKGCPIDFVFDELSP